MRLFIVTLLSTSLVLSGFTMASNILAAHEGKVTCPFAQMQDGACSNLTGLALAVHHMSNLQNLSQALPTMLLLSLILLLASPLFLVTAIYLQNFVAQVLSLTRSQICRLRSSNTFYIPIFNIPLMWTALHNKNGRIFCYQFA